MPYWTKGRHREEMERGDELHVPLGGNQPPSPPSHVLIALPVPSFIPSSHLLPLTWFFNCVLVRRHTRRQNQGGSARQDGAEENNFDNVGEITVPILVAASLVALLILLILRLAYPYPFQKQQQ